MAFRARRSPEWPRSLGAAGERLVVLTGFVPGVEGAEEARERVTHAASFGLIAGAVVVGIFISAFRDGSDEVLGLDAASALRSSVFPSCRSLSSLLGWTRGRGQPAPPRP